jgi:hypothetical protein
VVFDPISTGLSQLGVRYTGGATIGDVTCRLNDKSAVPN